MSLHPKNPLVLATRNKGKVREFQAALAELPWRLESLTRHAGVPPARETGRSFQENARLKAEHYHRLLQKPVLADDSGLVVPALAGRPGIHSARLAPTDPERIQELLRLLRGKTGSERSAYFVCALCLLAGDLRLETEGRVQGVILEEPRGRGGFGYDPIFFYPPLGKTFAQLSRAQKNRISHRAQALRKLKELLLQRISEAH